MDRHVAIYCRLSPRPDGTSEGVDVQERQGRAYAAQAWPGVPVVVYSDRLLSAADEDVWRPGFEKLRQAIRDGEVAHLWCVEQSRLQRLEVGWFVLAAELAAAGIDEIHTGRDGIVRVADDIAGIKAVLDGRGGPQVEEARERPARRQRRPGPACRVGAVRASGMTPATTGPRPTAQVPGGGRRRSAESMGQGSRRVEPVGHRRRPPRAGAHRGARRHPDRGLGPLVADQPDRRRVAGAPRRDHRAGQLGPDPDRGRMAGVPGEARRPAGGCPLGTAGPTRSARRTPATPGRKYVLTGGLAVCGVCGRAVVGSVKQLKGGARRGGRDVPYYLCHPSRAAGPAPGSCSSPPRSTWQTGCSPSWTSPAFLDAIAEDAHAARREEITTALSAIDAKREELAGLWGTPGGLTSGEWAGARAALDASERELRAELAEKGPPPARVNIEQARASWPLMTLGEQREFLRLFIARVTIGRARPGLQRFDPDRITIEWRKR